MWVGGVGGWGDGGGMGGWGMLVVKSLPFCVANCGLCLDASAKCATKVLANLVA